jgi:hypothetical protein
MMGTLAGTTGCTAMVKVGESLRTPFGEMRTPASDGRVMLKRNPGGVAMTGENSRTTPSELTLQLISLKNMLVISSLPS